MPKAQRTRGLSSGYQSNFFWSYHKFSNKSWSEFILIISTKQQLQNLNQRSAFWLNLNFKILTSSFGVSTKNNIHNLNQGSATKYWLNFSFKIMPELQLQNLYQTLCSKSEKSLASKSATNCPQHASKHQHQQQSQSQKVLCWHLHMPGSHQSSVINRC